MKKYIFHVLYIMVILFLVVLANIRSNEAVKQEQLAREFAERAAKTEKLAEQEAARAIMEETKALEIKKELEACKAAQK